MTDATCLSSAVCFQGLVQKWEHKSAELGESCDRMKFSVFIPSCATAEKPVPVVYWLSGLTCNEDNFITKAGAQRVAEELGLMLVCPDTSPRGCKIEGEDDTWDFGTGAGFYVDATEKKWAANYRMYSYVVSELPAVVKAALPMADTSRASIMGHSMGGHGALVLGLRNLSTYKSISAFAPICNPMNCPWGEKAFTGYLGSNKEAWRAYDACELLKMLPQEGSTVAILVDQGLADNFLTDKQLLPEALEEAGRAAGAACELHVNMREGYNHSYYFIASFIEDHIRFHAKHLF